MNLTHRLALALTGLLALLLLAACEPAPAPGRPCPTPGTTYAHVDSHHRVFLTCGDDGTWHK